MDTRQGITWVAGQATPEKTWITRVFNFGTWEEWQTMKQSTPPEKIKEALQIPLKGQWTRQGKAFAEVVYSCKLPDDVIMKYDI